MEEIVIIRCPRCGVKNRVPLSRIQAGPRCGKCKAPLSAETSEPVVFTDMNFEDLIKTSLPVLVDCWAPWCGPCRVIGPIIEELAKEFSGRALIGKLNVDENPITAQRFQIQSIPTLLFFKNGRIEDSIIGLVPGQEIRQRLAALM